MCPRLSASVYDLQPYNFTQKKSDNFCDSVVILPSNLFPIFSIFLVLRLFHVGFDSFQPAKSLTISSFSAIAILCTLYGRLCLGSAWDNCFVFYGEEYYCRNRRWGRKNRRLWRIGMYHTHFLYLLYLYHARNWDKERVFLLWYTVPTALFRWQGQIKLSYFQRN